MDNSNYVSLSLAMSMRRSLDVAANNIANSETAGFKGEEIVFEEFMHKQSPSKTGISFFIDKESWLDTNQGGLIPTGNDLDVAVQGSGWLGYETPEGRMAFGRDGRMLVDNLGNLKTYTGMSILDNGGTPIAIPPNSGTISISGDGLISDRNGNEIANIGIFNVPDIQGYERLGKGAFSPPVSSGDPNLSLSTDSRTLQGFVEQSNVEPIIQLTKLMDIQRSYERSIKLSDNLDNLKRTMLNKLGRI